MGFLIFNRSISDVQFLLDDIEAEVATLLFDVSLVSRSDRLVGMKTVTCHIWFDPAGVSGRPKIAPQAHSKGFSHISLRNLSHMGASKNPLCFS